MTKKNLNEFGFVGLNRPMLSGDKDGGGVYLCVNSVVGIIDVPRRDDCKTCIVELENGKSYEVLGDGYHILQQILAVKDKYDDVRGTPIEQ